MTTTYTTSTPFRQMTSFAGVLDASDARDRREWRSGAPVSPLSGVSAMVPYPVWLVDDEPTEGTAEGAPAA